MRALPKHMFKWARHITGLIKKEKHRLASIIDELEAFAEFRHLTAREIELKSQLNADIATLLREE
jgi:hypothetical protein